MASPAPSTKRPRSAASAGERPEAKRQAREPEATTGATAPTDDLTAQLADHDDAEAVQAAAAQAAAGAGSAGDEQQEQQHQETTAPGRLHTCCAPGGKLHGKSAVAVAAYILRHSGPIGPPKPRPQQHQQQVAKVGQQQQQRHPTGAKKLPPAAAVGKLQAGTGTAAAAAAAGGGGSSRGGAAMRRRVGPSCDLDTQGVMAAAGGGAGAGLQQQQQHQLQKQQQQGGQLQPGLRSYPSGRQQQLPRSSSGVQAGRGANKQQQQQPHKPQSKGFDLLLTLNSIGPILPERPDDASPQDQAARAAAGGGLGHDLQQQVTTAAAAAGEAEDAHADAEAEANSAGSSGQEHGLEEAGGEAAAAAAGAADGSDEEYYSRDSRGSAELEEYECPYSPTQAVVGAAAAAEEEAPYSPLEAAVAASFAAAATAALQQVAAAAAGYRPGASGAGAAAQADAVRAAAPVSAYAPAGYVPTGCMPARPMAGMAADGVHAAGAAAVGPHQHYHHQQQQHQQQQHEQQLHQQRERLGSAGAAVQAKPQHQQGSSSQLWRMLRSGPAPGELLPSVTVLQRLLQERGVSGLKVLVDPSSLQQIQQQSKPILDWLCAHKATIYADPRGIQVPPPDKVNLVLVHDSVGVDSVLYYTDYLVSGVLVVSQRFLQLLQARKGRLSPQDWDSAPQWLYFCSGVRLLLDATLIDLASIHDHVQQQLVALMEALSAVKQLMPAGSPCGAYVSRNHAQLQTGLLQQWLLSGLLQPLPSLPAEPNSSSSRVKTTTSTVNQARQLLLQQNQLAQQDSAAAAAAAAGGGGSGSSKQTGAGKAATTAAAAAAAAGGGNGGGASGNNEPPAGTTSGARKPIPSPRADCSLRYMLVVLPNFAPDTQGLLTTADWEYVGASEDNVRNKIVVGASVSHALHFLHLLKQQLLQRRTEV